MSTPALVMLSLYGLIVAWWGLLHVLMFFYKPRRYFLGIRAPRLCGNNGPHVSILLAAKDEEGNIGRCVRSVLAAEYNRWELIVIDDRSRDNTAAEVTRAAGGDPRVRLIRIQELPAGWTGKMNAINQGLAQARGEVILIMDADTQHAPQALGAALAALQRKRASMLSLLPRLEHRTWLSRIVQPMVGALVCVWKPLPWVNSRKRKHVFLGWGGFLMVRRQALEQVGGLEAVKDRFAADIALAGLMKKHGNRIRVYHAPDLISTYFYPDVAGMIRGWTRLLRITVDNRPRPLALTFLALLGLGLSAYAMVGAGLVQWLMGGSRELALWLGGLGLLCLGLQVTFLGRICKISGTPPAYALGHLPAMIGAGYLTIAAMLRCRSTDMNWRGTSYRLHRDGRAFTAQ